MEKVKITKEQEVALNEWKDCDFSFIDFTESTWRGSWTDAFKPLNDVTPEDFSLMLNGWYEVKESFKVGDWYETERTEEYVQIWQVVDKEIFYKYSSDTSSIYKRTFEQFDKYFMKIEEPWKIMLLDLGRTKPKVVEGDSYTYKRVDGTTTSTRVNVPEHEMHTRLFSQGHVIEFFPKSNGIKLQGGN